MAAMRADGKAGQQQQEGEDAEEDLPSLTPRTATRELDEERERRRRAEVRTEQLSRFIKQAEADAKKRETTNRQLEADRDNWKRKWKTELDRMHKLQAESARQVEAVQRDLQGQVEALQKLHTHRDRNSQLSHLLRVKDSTQERLEAEIHRLQDLLSHQTNTNPDTKSAEKAPITPLSPPPPPPVHIPPEATPAFQALKAEYDRTLSFITGTLGLPGPPQLYQWRGTVTHTGEGEGKGSSQQQIGEGGGAPEPSSADGGVQAAAAAAAEAKGKAAPPKGPPPKFSGARPPKLPSVKAPPPPPKHPAGGKRAPPISKSADAANRGKKAPMSECVNIQWGTAGGAPPRADVGTEEILRLQQQAKFSQAGVGGGHSGGKEEGSGKHAGGGGGGAGVGSGAGTSAKGGRMSVGGAGAGGGAAGVGEKGRVVVDFDQTVRDFPEAVAARQSLTKRQLNPITPSIFDLDEEGERLMQGVAQDPRLVELFKRKPTKAAPDSFAAGGAKPQRSSCLTDKGQKRYEVARQRIAMTVTARLRGCMSSREHPHWLHEFKRLFLECNLEFLNKELINSLMDAVPKDEDIAAVLQYKQDHPGVPLLAAEEFVYNMSTIPRLKERLECMAFKLYAEDSFKETIQYIEDQLAALDMLMKSKRLHHLFLVIVAIGNKLNEGTTLGNRQWFRLKTLKMLGDTKMTTADRRERHVLHYLIETFPWTREVLDEKDMRILAKAQQQHVAMTYTLGMDHINSWLAIKAEYRQERRRNSMAPHEADKRDCFHQVMADFHKRSVSQVIQMDHKLGELRDAYTAAVLYFGDVQGFFPIDARGDDPNTCSMRPDLCKTVYDFLKDLRKAAHDVKKEEQHKQVKRTPTGPPDIPRRPSKPVGRSSKGTPVRTPTMPTPTSHTHKAGPTPSPLPQPGSKLTPPSRKAPSPPEDGKGAPAAAAASGAASGAAVSPVSPVIGPLMEFPGRKTSRRPSFGVAVMPDAIPPSMLKRHIDNNDGSGGGKGKNARWLPNICAAFPRTHRWLLDRFPNTTATLGLKKPPPKPEQAAPYPPPPPASHATAGPLPRTRAFLLATFKQTAKHLKLDSTSTTPPEAEQVAQQSTLWPHTKKYVLKNFPRTTAKLGMRHPPPEREQVAPPYPPPPPSSSTAAATNESIPTLNSQGGSANESSGETPCSMVSYDEEAAHGFGGEADNGRAGVSDAASTEHTDSNHELMDLEIRESDKPRIDKEPPRVSLRYKDGHEYRGTFNELIRLLAVYEKQTKESQAQTNITVRWEVTPNGRRTANFRLRKAETDVRSVVGNEVRIKYTYDAIMEYMQQQHEARAATHREEMADLNRKHQEEIQWMMQQQAQMQQQMQQQKALLMQHLQQAQCGAGGIAASISYLLALLVHHPSGQTEQEIKAELLSRTKALRRALPSTLARTTDATPIS
ncbi:unnamed protein product [Vitrella brassicaformis CCMP3155]|uniref:FH2 domain-containing protein n=1 Tax=Vitrella brassicaformis (strain CCMP3155) TaxID=1169540 RepID=A0A0G4G8A8_VITBC|nr:unnamed protein product [Vitrella brassicaformis CCMP3155]|eukprot:CEM25070.1 unnamed protein product [Vitrella brassicaformis CCMP3155]